MRKENKTIEFMVSHGCHKIIPLLDADDMHSIMNHLRVMSDEDLMSYAKTIMKLPISKYNREAVIDSLLNMLYYEYHNRMTCEPTLFKKSFPYLIALYFVLIISVIIMLWRF